VREKEGDLAPTEEAQDSFGRALHSPLSHRPNISRQHSCEFLIHIKITSQRYARLTIDRRRQ